MRRLGPNHRDGCDGRGWRHSGDCYNRVRVCPCGAEDHDPEPKSIEQLAEEARLFAQLLEERDAP